MRSLLLHLDLYRTKFSHTVACILKSCWMKSLCPDSAAGYKLRYVIALEFFDPLSRNLAHQFKYFVNNVVESTDALRANKQACR